MRDDLEALLRQSTLTTLALAIALGWSLFQVARGVSDLVTGLLTTYPQQDLPFAHSQALMWVVGRRVLSLTSLVAGLVELAVVLLVAILVGRRTAHSTG